MKKIIFILIISLWMFSCGKKDGTERGVKETLVYAQLSETKSLDPHAVTDQYSQRIIANIYDRLVEVDESMNIIPSLALSWENIDPLTTVFHLRENVKFHSGKKMTAKDVKFSLERAMKSPQLGSLYSLFDKVEVIDETTVVVKTKKPFGPLLYHLSHKSASILNEEFAKDHDLNQEADGTGGYFVKEWQVGDYILLERNKDYFNGEPSIKFVKVRSVPEENSKVIGLETGEIDISADLESMSRKTVLDNEKLTLAETSSFSTQFLGMNVEKPFLKDIRIRKAIAMAINKDIIIDALLMGAVENANSFLAPGVFGYSKDVDTYQYDPAKAKELIAETGYKNIKLTLLRSNNTTRAQIAEVIQAQLMEVGITLSIQVVEWGAFLSDTSRGKAELYMLGWSPSTGDADYGLSPNIHSSNKGSGGNRSFYSNPKVDKLLDDAKEELDVEKRLALYKEVQEIVNKDVAYFPIYYQLANAGLNKNILGYVQTSANYPYFYKLSFKNKRL